MENNIYKEFGKIFIGLGLIGALMCVGIQFGIKKGRALGENELLEKQDKSASYIANNIVIVKDCYDSIDKFTFDVCKGLGLLKKGVKK